MTVRRLVISAPGGTLDCGSFNAFPLVVGGGCHEGPVQAKRGATGAAVLFLVLASGPRGVAIQGRQCRWWPGLLRQGARSDGAGQAFGRTL